LSERNFGLSFPRCPFSFAERKDKTCIFQLPLEALGEAMLPGIPALGEAEEYVRRKR